MTTVDGKFLGETKCLRKGHKWRIVRTGAPGSDGQVRGMARCARCKAKQNVAIAKKI